MSKGGKRELVTRASVDLSWLPLWVELLEVPVWISGPDGRLDQFNELARETLDLSSDCLGQECHEVLAGHAGDGQPVCSADCPIRRRAAARQTLEPWTVGVGRPARWVRILWIPLWSPTGSGPWLVHCALDVQKARRIEEYMINVANRTRDPERGRGALTSRERQVLGSMAQDLDQREIARSLYLSRATVRNHVQHILYKLDAHSIQEAVALYLLDGSRATEGGRSSRER